MDGKRKKLLIGAGLIILVVFVLVVVSVAPYLLALGMLSSSGQGSNGGADTCSGFRRVVYQEHSFSKNGTFKLLLSNGAGTHLEKGDYNVFIDCKPNLGYEVEWYSAKENAEKWWGSKDKLFTFDLGDCLTSKKAGDFFQTKIMVKHVIYDGSVIEDIATCTGQVSS